MISSPKRVGLRTSTAASRMISILGRVPPSSARRRTQFSIMMTLESTSRPKSIAPRLIRLAVTPVASITLAAKSIESGIARATISPARMFPSSASKTTMTSTPPSRRLCFTVSSVCSIRWLRS